MTSHEKPYQPGQTSQESAFFPRETTATILDLTHNFNHPEAAAQRQTPLDDYLLI